MRCRLSSEQIPQDCLFIKSANPILSIRLRQKSQVRVRSVLNQWLVLLDTTLPSNHPFPRGLYHIIHALHVRNHFFGSDRICTASTSYPCTCTWPDTPFSFAIRNASMALFPCHDDLGEHLTLTQQMIYRVPMVPHVSTYEKHPPTCDQPFRFRPPVPMYALSTPFLLRKIVRLLQHAGRYSSSFGGFTLLAETQLRRSGYSSHGSNDYCLRVWTDNAFSHVCKAVGSIASPKEWQLG